MDAELENFEPPHIQNFALVDKPKQTWETPTLRIAKTEDTASGGLSSFFENTNYYPATPSVS